MDSDSLEPTSSHSPIGESPRDGRRSPVEMPLPTLLDRGRGSMLGLAVGDALGAPLEGLTAQQIGSHYGTVTDYVDGARAWKRKPPRWRLPGLYTDDTQQALVLSEVLLERGRVESDRVAELYIDLANPRDEFFGAHRGVGRSFRQAVTEMEKGTEPTSCGQQSAGIGAAMRIAPLALYFAGDPDALFESALEASLMTHRDIRSLAGAMAVAHAVRRLLDGAPLTAALLFRVASDVARAEDRIIASRPDRVTSAVDHAKSLSRSIAFVESVLELGRVEALQLLVDQANRHGPRTACKKPTMGFPPVCIPTCFYLLLACESLEEALVEAVNLGGDADSTGAILGALAGAHYGASAIPERWLIHLHNREGVERRADALLARSRSGLDLPDLLETERLLTRTENVCRQGLRIQGSGGTDFGNARPRR